MNNSLLSNISQNKTKFTYEWITTAQYIYRYEWFLFMMMDYHIWTSGGISYFCWIALYVILYHHYDSRNNSTAWDKPMFWAQLCLLFWRVSTNNKQRIVNVYEETNSLFPTINKVRRDNQHGGKDVHWTHIIQM